MNNSRRLVLIGLFGGLMGLIFQPPLFPEGLFAVAGGGFLRPAVTPQDSVPARMR